MSTPNKQSAAAITVRAVEWHDLVAASLRNAMETILQTGDRQPDAVRLYEREGYTRIPIFPPYEWMTFSICMEKVIDPA